MINVLIVDDSQSVRDFLEHLIGSDPEMRIAGKVRNGYEALDFLEKSRPDVITMDIQMPELDGFETTRRIMETNPVPIVIISSLWQPGEVTKTFQAMEAGAVAILQKPAGFLHPDHTAGMAELLNSIKQAAAAKVRKLRVMRQVQSRAVPASPASAMAASSSGTIKVVALGASTGGPPAIMQLLSALPAHFPVPILIVQHIATGFAHGFADWLDSLLPLSVSLARDGEPMLPGHVYVAPDGLHLLHGPDSSIRLRNDPPEYSMRPAVSCLFRSVAQARGRAAAGILLTGMGRDGAAELKLIRDAGGITFAQDQATSIIHGMPGEAVRLNACTHVLPPVHIAAQLAGLVVPAATNFPNSQAGFQNVVSEPAEE